MKKGMLERTADGSRKLRQVDIKSISDVSFGVPDRSDPFGSVLILTQRRQWVGILLVDCVKNPYNSICGERNGDKFTSPF